WGAQAASLPFAAACRELFLPCSRVPNPRIIVFRLRNPSVPGIPRYIFKFFLEVAFRSNHSVKRLRFPHWFIDLLNFVNSICRRRFNAVQYFGERKENRISRFVLAFDHRFYQEMYVIWHHAGAKELVTPAIPARTAASRNSSSERNQPVAQNRVMVLRQNLSPRHQRRLPSRLDGDQHCSDSRDRLPRANVALQQTVQRRCHLQIAPNLVKEP